jgi:hypothetical protein
MPGSWKDAPNTRKKKESETLQKNYRFYNTTKKVHQTNPFRYNVMAQMRLP